MQIIITGGSGLIGRALSRELIDNGHKVVWLSRTLRPAGDIRVVRWDGHSSEGWLEVLEESDAIVNLAGAGIGERRWSVQQKELILSSRLKAGRAVVEAVKLAARRPQVVVQASGIDYYGFAADQIVAEDAPVGNRFLARTARAWEESTAEVESYGVRRVIIRSAMVLSLEAPAMQKMLLPMRLFVGGPLGSGRQWMPWIHINDEVRAIRYLLEGDYSGAFNLCAPEPCMNRDFMRMLGRVMHRPALMPAPACLLRLALGEMADLLLDTKRALPVRLQAAGFKFEHGRLEEALISLLRNS